MLERDPDATAGVDIRMTHLIERHIDAAPRPHWRSLRITARAVRATGQVCTAGVAI